MTKLAVVHEDVRDRADARRVILRTALSSGDVRASARAASRARLVVMSLSPEEAAHARTARRRLGRAIRLARAGRRAATVTAAPLTFTPQVSASPPRRRRLLPTVALVLAAAAALPSRDTLVPNAEGRDRALTALICARALAGPNGRPRPEPLLAPAPQYYGATISDAQGVAPRIDAKSALPVRGGSARLIGRVVDDASGLPLDDACLEFARGPLSLETRTDAAGMFVVDLPVSGRPVDLLFGRVGYRPVRITLDSWGSSPVNFFFDVRLIPQ